MTREPYPGRIVPALPFPVFREHLGTDVSLFFVHVEAWGYCNSFHYPMEDAQLGFIYCLDGTAEIRYSQAETAGSTIRMCKNTGMIAYLPDAKGEIFINEGEIFHGIILQVRLGFLQSVQKMGGRTTCPYLRDILHDRQTCRMVSVSVPFAFGILLQRIFEFSSDNELLDIFLTGKKYELLYKQLAMNIPAPLQPEGINRREYKAVCKIYEQMRAHIAFQPHLEDLAASAGLSRSRLTALFRTVFGDTVFGILRRERLTCARELLEEASDKNITEIAYYCGFSSSAHFTKSFSAQFGVTPREYRMRSRLP